MKIGLSFSRCVRDIVDGKVDLEDVLIVIARTDFDPRDDLQWKGIWEGYGGGSHAGSLWSNPEWSGYDNEEQFRNTAIELWNSGRLHQPRQFGAYVARRPEIWLETVLPNEELEKNPAAKAAWSKFQMVAGLTSVKLDKEYK
jgi:hypothetical protein